MTKAWSTAQREEAARRARLHRPWLYSTGPRTREGKRASALNSFKHGYYSVETQTFRLYLRVCVLRLKQIKGFEIIQRRKHRIWKETRNELTLKYYKWDRNPLRFPHKVFKNGPMFTTDGP